MKKTDWGAKAHKIVKKEGHPSPENLEKFLEDKEDITNEPYSHDSVHHEKTDKKIYKREEFKFPISLSEKLRLASFSSNKKKTDIVQEALLEYFVKNGL